MEGEKQQAFDKIVSDRIDPALLNVVTHKRFFREEARRHRRNMTRIKVLIAFTSVMGVVFGLFTAFADRLGESFFQVNDIVKGLIQIAILACVIVVFEWDRLTRYSTKAWVSNQIADTCSELEGEISLHKGNLTKELADGKSNVDQLITMKLNDWKQALDNATRSARIEEVGIYITDSARNKAKKLAIEELESNDHTP